MVKIWTYIHLFVNKNLPDIFHKLYVHTKNLLNLEIKTRLECFMDCDLYWWDLSV